MWNTDNDKDELISQFLRVNVNRFSYEKKRELAMMIRTLQLQRQSRLTVLKQDIDQLRTNVQLYFDQMNFWKQYENVSLEELSKVGEKRGEQLISSHFVKIPRSLVEEKPVPPLPVVRSMPSLKARSAKHSKHSSKHLMQSTMMSASVPTLPKNLGNISVIAPHKPVVQYKGCRRVSILKSLKEIHRNSTKKSSAPNRTSMKIVQTSDKSEDMELMLAKKMEHLWAMCDQSEFRKTIGNIRSKCVNAYTEIIDNLPENIADLPLNQLPKYNIEIRFL